MPLATPVEEVFIREPRAVMTGRSRAEGEGRNEKEGKGCEVGLASDRPARDVGRTNRCSD